jgi:hypothetical protein
VTHALDHLDGGVRRDPDLHRAAGRAVLEHGEVVLDQQLEVGSCGLARAVAAEGRRDLGGIGETTSGSHGDRSSHLLGHNGHMRHRLAALTALLACVAPALAACGSHGTTAHVGDVVPARQDRQFASARRSSVALPIGRLEIHTGTPVTQLNADDTRELATQTAPAGMTYLPITWQYDGRTPAAYLTFVGTTALPTVDLAIGEKSFRLPSPDPSQGAESFYVLVPRSDDDPSAAVHFDGVTQSADLATGKVHAGRARGLYRLSFRHPRTFDCRATPHWKKVAVSKGTCQVTDPILLPYAGGRWAKPGHEWLVVSVQTTFSTYTQAGATMAQGGIYYPVGLTTTYRLGRRKPVQVLESNDDSSVCPVPQSGACNSSASLIFDHVGRSRTLVLRQDYRLQLGSGWGGFAGPRLQTQTGVTTIELGRAR